MIKSLAPLALAGIASALLWKILQILMAPVIAWILGMLMLGLKIGLGVAVLFVAFYGIKRVVQSRAKPEEDA